MLPPLGAQFQKPSPAQQVSVPEYSFKSRCRASPSAVLDDSGRSPQSSARSVVASIAGVLRVACTIPSGFPSVQTRRPLMTDADFRGDVLHDAPLSLRPTPSNPVSCTLIRTLLHVHCPGEPRCPPSCFLSHGKLKALLPRTETQLNLPPASYSIASPPPLPSTTKTFLTKSTNQQDPSRVPPIAKSPP